MGISQQMCAAGLHSFEDFKHEVYPGARCSNCGKWDLVKKNTLGTVFLEIGMGIITVGLISIVLLNIAVTVYLLI